MDQNQLYELVCDTFYASSSRIRSKHEVLERLKARGLTDDNTTDYSSLCVEGNPSFGLDDPATAALLHWIEGNEAPPEE